MGFWTIPLGISFQDSSHSWVCANQLTSSNQPTGFRLDSDRGNQIFSQNWYLVEFIMPSILASAPGSLEIKQPKNITDQPPYFTVGMTCFSLHLCSYAKHADAAVPDKNLTFWSHLTRAPCSSHNVNDIWQTPSASFCVLWSEKAFFWQPFQWGCGYGGGVWWCFLKLGDPKKPPRPAILSLWSLDHFVASLTVLLRVLGGKMQLRPLPMRFSTVPYLLNVFIISLTVLSRIFNCLQMFL